MYIIPLVSLLIGIGLGFLLGRQLGVNEEVSSLVVGFICLALTYWMIRKNESHFHTRKFRPIAGSIVKHNDDVI
jgi:positive regulator of sigma E activity